MEKDTSGLDMKPVIEWHEKNRIIVPNSPAYVKCSVPVEGKEHIALTESELENIIMRFPQNARERSVLRKIIGKGPLYFASNPLDSKNPTTANPDEAISRTAIIPSFTGYADEENGFGAYITLFNMANVASERAIKQIIAEGFAHEYAHTFITQALYLKDYRMQMPDGKIITGEEMKQIFGEMAERHAPISHYASAYRDEANKFKGDVKTCVNEEMAETITAYILGFAYCKDPKRIMKPFADRPEIKEFTEQFLNAKLVK